MPRLTAGDVACWVLETSTPPAQLSPDWSAGHDGLVIRCVRPCYRLGLMAAGSNPSWLTAGRFAAVLARIPRNGLGPWVP
ncbi:hypothetical protein [Blastococcus capsensis]|uniref:hypothetical protein n=1 Tax=Blastococcus capsensis TaxID=1564163 RepID=UPI00253F8570|nr:hypothetical protein [Blastococcus capsensis]MDK3257997.1 hypothetical protein [Blastococcus capsensis]